METDASIFIFQPSGILRRDRRGNGITKSRRRRRMRRWWIFNSGEGAKRRHGLCSAFRLRLSERNAVLQAALHVSPTIASLGCCCRSFETGNGSLYGRLTTHPSGAITALVGFGGWHLCGYLFVLPICTYSHSAGCLTILKFLNLLKKLFRIFIYIFIFFLLTVILCVFSFFSL